MHFLYGIHNRKDKGAHPDHLDRVLLKKQVARQARVAMVPRPLFWAEPMLETNPKDLDTGGRKLSSDAGLK
jgi:hypothetical protein